MPSSSSYLLVLVTSGLIFAAGMAATQPVAAQDGPAVERVLPDLNGSILDREDLRRVAEAQNHRDTVGLLMSLEDPDPAVRGRAALAFGSVRSPISAPVLYPRLQDSDPSVRAFAAFGIGQSRQVSAQRVLLDALRRESDRATLVQIMHALGRIGDQVALADLVSATIPAALNAERALAVARFGIRDVHDPAAIRLLVGHLADGDPRVRRNAAYYFGRITTIEPWADVADEVAQASVRLNPDDEAQLFLATALGRLQSVNREGHILRLLAESSDWRIRVNAARALGGEWRTQGGTTALIARLDDSSHHVASAAAIALAGGDPLASEQLDHLEEWIDRHPADWQVWTGFLPALLASGRLHPVLSLLDSDLPIPALAAVIRSLGADDSNAAFAILVDATAHPDARVAAAAVDALRSRWQRESDPARASHYLQPLTGALQRAEGAVVFAAAPVLGHAAFLELGSGTALREVYHQLRTGRNVGPMDAIIRAHGAARDTSALDFLVNEAIEAPHPVLRQAAVETLTERFAEGFHFSTLGGSPPTFPTIDWDYIAELGSTPRLILETDRGTVVLQLETEWAPATVQAITQIARDGHYDGVPFHRVVPNFVIQGGDFDPGDGFGGPGFFLPSEFTPLSYTAGTLGMASSGPDTEGSQFFVTHSMQPHLDGNYTVFGQVVSGQSVVDTIRADDRILSTRIESSR